ncbi:hypothetical protein [Shewanella sp. UCD-KL12]|uniref:hypothetical protein n=1 Tax=Shewanella sp. UCD-KL12 TaxID=1917163 RepID=UPI00097061A3|nr:hypothetical protein [Shewanella sp. UCD-KL12]
MKKALEQDGSTIELHKPENNREACKQLLQQSHEQIAVTGYFPPSNYKLLLTIPDESQPIISLIYQDTDLIYQLITEQYQSTQDGSLYTTAGVYRTLLSNKHEAALHGISRTLINHLALKSYLVVGSQQLQPETKRFWLARLYEAVDSKTLMLYARAQQNQVVIVQSSAQLMYLLKQNTTFVISALQAKPNFT